MSQILQVLPFVALAAFLAEYIDSSLGMGFGTTLTPIILLMGFEPLQVVPAVLLSEFVTGFVAAWLHHTMGNVRLVRGSIDLPVALVLGGLGILGAGAAALVAVNLPKEWLGRYIGLTVLATGILLLFTAKHAIRFSWRRLAAIGLVAAFNKSIGGGGYGALIVGGQMLSGLNPKAAIGVTSLAESVVCLAGLVTYFLLTRSFDWQLSMSLLVGALLSTPLAALTVKRLQLPHLRLGVALGACALGLVITLGFARA